VIETFAGLLGKEAQIYTPYGATEAMPVTSIGSDEILSETKHLSEQGFGNCVGRPLIGIDVRLIRTSDAPIATWSEDLRVPDGEIGEIVVEGELVTRKYFNRPEEERLSKISENNRLLHRMGDLGWKDKKGRIWFCGRKNHRVVTSRQTLYTIPCEAVFNCHPEVRRSALVGVGPPGNQRPVICIELHRKLDRADREKLRESILALARSAEHTKAIETVLFHDAFPVDVRHNAKIFREKLAAWAERRLKGAKPGAVRDA